MSKPKSVNALAWEMVATFAEREIDQIRTYFDVSDSDAQIHRHILTSVVPSLRRMAERIQRRHDANAKRGGKCTKTK
jgi:hypothetical protein